jgi:hypothetical protein
LLLAYTIHTGPATTWITLLAVLSLSFGFEVIYRRVSGRRLAPADPELAGGTPDQH